MNMLLKKAVGAVSRSYAAKMGHKTYLAARPTRNYHTPTKHALKEFKVSREAALQKI